MTWFSRRRRTANGSQTQETLEVRTLLAAGDLDASFGGDGVAEISIPGDVAGDTVATTIVKQADGKLIVGAEFPPNMGAQKALVLRVNPDGKLDPSFGTGGRVSLGDAPPHKIAVQSDGKILVASDKLYRLNSDGSLDTDFGLGGSVNKSGSFVLTTDGSIWLGGSRLADPAPNPTIPTITRISSTGVEEATFDAAEFPAQMTALPGGGFLASYWEVPSFGDVRPITYRIARYTPSGNLDTTFGSQGLASFTLDGYKALSGTDAAVTEDGSFYFSGRVEGGVFTIRFTSGGNLDTNFFGSGFRVVSVNLNNAVQAAAMPDGGVSLVVDPADEYVHWKLAQFRPNGDVIFGTLRERLIDQLADALVTTAGSLVVLATGTPATQPRHILLTRFLADFSPDTTFGGDGDVILFGKNPSSAVVIDAPTPVAIQPDGKVIVSATNDQDLVVARLNPDGTPDSSFGSAGLVRLGATLQLDNANSMSAVRSLSDGRILVALLSASRELVVRLLPSGQLDRDFGSGGFIEFTQLVGVSDLVELRDGRFLILGSTGTTNGSRVLRLEADGGIDRTFGDNGVVDVGFSGDTIAVWPNGKFSVAGTQRHVPSTTTQRFLARKWFANGSLDPTFGSGSLVDFTPSSEFKSSFDTPRHSLVTADNQLLVLSLFGKLGPILSRLNEDGKLDPTFGTGGVLTISASQEGIGGGLFGVESNGSILASLGGPKFVNDSAERFARVVRFTPNGGADASWGATGQVTVNNLNFPGGYAIAPDGRVLLAAGGIAANGSPVLRVTRLLNDPGILFLGSGTLTTTETGTTATFEVRLSSKPTADVTIPVASSDTSEGTVSVNSLTFTPDNWSTAQSVTITGVDDTLFDTDQRYRILLGPATSTDADYNGRTVKPVEVRNRDDETLRFFRAFNPQANFHFFTTNVSEFQGVQPNGYNDESSGRGGFSLVATAQPGFTQLFRLYNLQKGYHYYTASVAEKDFLLSLNPPSTDPNFGKIGWRFEGSPGFIADTQQAGTNQVFRLYNKTSGAHLFTENPAVRAAVLQSTEWEEHAPLGFAFLVDDAEPTTATPPPPDSVSTARVDECPG